ncbi:hypothetical protein N7507_000700 [Penicillium longicatenatum]|nr:hypothetical protein N7507_000700 [Penicillium longicatenatum]
MSRPPVGRGDMPLDPRLQFPTIIIEYLEVDAGLSVAGVNAVLVMFQHSSQLNSRQSLSGHDSLRASRARLIRSPGIGRGSTGKLWGAPDIIGLMKESMWLLTWGHGVFWWCFAILSIGHTLGARPRGGRKPPFTLAVWSIIFPWLLTIRGIITGRIFGLEHGGGERVWTR